MPREALPRRSAKGPPQPHRAPFVFPPHVLKDAASRAVPAVAPALNRPGSASFSKLPQRLTAS
eukprot:3000144-Lingulodinium_polyedra.AAC.1